MKERERKLKKKITKAKIECQKCVCVRNEKKVKKIRGLECDTKKIGKNTHEKRCARKTEWRGRERESYSGVLRKKIEEKHFGSWDPIGA